MKRILFFLHLPPPIHGASTVGKIIEEGFDIQMIYSKKYRNIGTTKNFSERRKITPRKFYRFFYQFFVNSRLLISNRPDLLYLTCSTHGMGFVKDSIYVLVCKLFRINCLLHFHNKGLHNKNLGKLGTWYHNLVLYNTRAILLSESLQNYYLPFLQIKNCFYLANGIKDHCENFDFYPKSKFRILFVSNLVLSKGILNLIKIALFLKKVTKDFQLDIVGNEAELSSFELERIISQNDLNENVVYHGPLFGQSKWELFDNASLFIYPSQEDCFPLVLLEAFSFGLPVICSNEGALGDIVHDGVNGHVVMDFDPEIYVQRISSLLNDKVMLKNFSLSARKCYEDNFTEKVFLSNFQDIISENL